MCPPAQLRQLLKPQLSFVLIASTTLASDHLIHLFIINFFINIINTTISNLVPLLAGQSDGVGVLGSKNVKRDNFDQNLKRIMTSIWRIRFSNSSMLNSSFPDIFTHFHSRQQIDYLWRFFFPVFLNQQLCICKQDFLHRIVYSIYLWRWNDDFISSPGPWHQHHDLFDRIAHSFQKYDIESKSSLGMVANKWKQ